MRRTTDVLRTEPGLLAAYKDILGLAGITPFSVPIQLGRKRKAALSVVSQERREDACPVCMDILGGKRHSVLMCGHVLCVDCVQGMADARPNQSSKCPVCR